MFILFSKGFPQFGKYLNETGRPMVYSCCWPFYQEDKGLLVSYEKLSGWEIIWLESIWLIY